MKNKTMKLEKRHNGFLGSDGSAPGGYSLDDPFQSGGRIVEDKQDGRGDLVGHMTLAIRRPDVLTNDLRAMSVTENGDEVPDLT